jgi:hypothetical protein
VGALAPDDRRARTVRVHKLADMLREVNQPDLGWAVRVSPEELARRRVRADRLHGLASGTNLVLVVLVVWNMLGLASFVDSLLSSGPTYQVALAAVIWLWVLGDISILGASLLIRRFGRSA